MNESDEIDLSEVFSVIKRFKYSILLIAFTTTIFATVFAYFSPNIYSSNTTVFIKSERGSPSDFMSMALGEQSNNVDNELEIIKSNYIISKALENLNLGTRYYTKHNLRTQELYQNSPFLVTTKSISKKATETLFRLNPVDDKSFELTLMPSFKSTIIYKIKSLLSTVSEEKKPIEYKKVFNYGEDILTPWFNINVQKLYTLENPSYSFTIMPNNEMGAFIKDSLSVSTLSKLATIINLSFQDNVPQRAIDILDAITSAYLKEELSYKKMSSEKTLEFLDTQIAGIYKNLKASATNLEQYKTDNQVLNLTGKASLSAEKLADLQTQLYELNIKENVFRNIATYIKENKDISGISLGSSSANDKAGVDSSINAIILKIQENTLLRNSLLIDYTELHPDVLKVTKNLQSLKRSLSKAIHSTLRNIANSKKTLNRTIEKHTNAINELPQQEREITELQRDFAANEHIYSFLQEKRAETAIVQSSTVSETRVIDSASQPEKPIKPKRALIVIVGLILGMIIGISLAFLRNYLDDTIKTVEDIEKHTDIPLYGAVPLFDPKSNHNQPYEEALRVIRTNLEFLYESNKSKLVTITSSIPTEGKTTLTTEVAKIIAKSHKTVIVLDLDMRRARAHEKYNLSNQKGMSTFLANKHSLMEVIQQTELENLSVITAGPTPPNPSELIMTKRMTKLIEVLMEKYDYVLLDTPPIGLVTDAMMLMKISDLNIFVMRANYSKKDFIKNINRFVEEHKLNNPGMVLNGVQLTKNSGYGYGYGYGYGHANDYYTNNS